MTDSTGAFSPDGQELQNLQRLAMVGTLAGGLGHDLRNVVMPILLRLDVLAVSDAVPDGVRADLAAIRQGLVHLQRLAGGLRLLGSDPRLRSEVQFTRLGPWWEEVGPLVIDALSASTNVEHDIDASLPDVAVSPSVLAHVIMNLAMNARRAMQDAARPVFRVHGRLVDARVQIEVSDNGVGMDDETRARCFEPFFTTRARELSTGLGLSTARALLTSSGGDLIVDATAPTGSTFVMILPLRRAGLHAADAPARTVRFLVHDPRQLAVLRLVARQRGLQELSGDAMPPDVLVADAEAIASLQDGKGADGAPSGPTRVIALGERRDVPGAPADTTWLDPRDLSSLGDLLR